MPQIRSSFVVRIVLEIENHRTSLLSFLIIFMCGLSSLCTSHLYPRPPRVRGLAGLLTFQFSKPR